jgi:hypothetical protein
MVITTYVHVNVTTPLKHFVLVYFLMQLDIHFFHLSLNILFWFFFLIHLNIHFFIGVVTSFFVWSTLWCNQSGNVSDIHHFIVFVNIHLIISFVIFSKTYNLKHCSQSRYVSQFFWIIEWFNKNLAMSLK